jgi:hypothetical protein
MTVIEDEEYNNSRKGTTNNNSYDWNEIGGIPCGIISVKRQFYVL